MNYRSTLQMKFIAYLVLFFTLTFSAFFKANIAQATAESCGWCAGPDQCYASTGNSGTSIPNSNICGGIHNCCRGYVGGGPDSSPTPSGGAVCTPNTLYCRKDVSSLCPNLHYSNSFEDAKVGTFCNAEGNAYNTYLGGSYFTDGCNQYEQCAPAQTQVCTPGKVYCKKDISICTNLSYSNPITNSEIGTYCNSTGTGYNDSSCSQFDACAPQSSPGGSCNGKTVIGIYSSRSFVGCSGQQNLWCNTTSTPVGQTIQNSNLNVYNESSTTSCGTLGGSPTPTGSPVPSGSGTASPTPPGSPVPTPPPGKFGYAQANCGGVFGWACDGKDYSKPLFITLYWDVQDQAHYIGKVTANQTGSAAIAQACGGNANHAFTITYPPGVVPPGQHQIIVVSHALNSSNVSDDTLPYYLTDATTAGLTPTIQCVGPSPSPSPTPPPNLLVKGYSTNNCNGVFGWACDGVNYSKALNVYAYVDSYDQAHLLNINVVANQTGDAGIALACGGNPAHIFSFNYPPSITPGTHKIWVLAGALNSSGVSDSTKQYLLLDTHTGGVGTIDRSACSSPVASPTAPPPVCGGVTCTIAGADQTPAPTKQVTCVMNPLDSSIMTPGTTASYEGTCSVVRSGVTFGLPPLAPISASSPQFRPFTLTAGTTTCQFSSCVTRSGIQTCTPWPIPGSQPL